MFQSKLGAANELDRAKSLVTSGADDIIFFRRKINDVIGMRLGSY